MNIATAIQNRCDEVYDNNILKDSKLKKCKALGAACLSGVIDGIVVSVPIILGVRAANAIIKKLK